MSAIIGALRGVLSLDSAAFDSGVNRAMAKMSTMERRMAKVGSRMQSIGKRMALGVTLPLATMGTAAVGASLKVVDAQAKLARSFDTTVKSIQVLDRAADLSGVSFGEMQQASIQLTKRLSEAAQGSGPAKDALKLLRLEATELQKLPLDQRISAIQESLAKYVPEAERAAVMSDLFGSRAGLIFSRIDSAAIAIATSDVERFGVAVSEIDAEQIQITNDAISRLGLVGRGMANQLAASLAPTLQSIADAMANVSNWFNGLSDQGRIFVGVAAATATAVGPLLIALGGVVKLVAPVVSGLGLIAAAARGVAVAMVAASGPWGVLAALAGGAAAYFLLFREEAEKIPTPLEAARAAQSSLNSQLGIFHAVAAPEAGKAAINAANDFYQMAAAAREAAASNLAMVQSELAAQQVWNDNMPWESFGGDMMEKVISEDVAVAKEELAQAEALLATAQNQRASTARQVMTADREMASNLGIVNDEVKIAIEGIDGLTTSLGQAGSSGSSSLAKLKAGVQDLEEPISQTGQLFGRTFSDIIRRSNDAGDALARLTDQLADQIFTSGFNSLWSGLGLDALIGSIFPSAKGNVFAGGRAVPFANGGVVTGPTLFPMPGRQTGLMGEAGPEAIMPLTRIGGKLGVRAQGGGSSGRVQVDVFVNDDGKIGAIARSEAQNVAVSVVEGGLRQYDQALPDRVQEISNDPRAR
jgi:hypothetical protein